MDGRYVASLAITLIGPESRPPVTVWKVGGTYVASFAASSAQVAGITPPLASAKLLKRLCDPFCEQVAKR